MALLPSRAPCTVTCCLELTVPQGTAGLVAEKEHTQHTKITVESVQLRRSGMGGGGEISRASTGLLEKRVEFELSSEGVSLVTI